MGDDAGVIAIRAALLTVALAACAWFALGVRAAHDQDAATNLLNQHISLTAAQANEALSQISNAGVLNPDETLNILRAQVELHSGHPARAVAVAEEVVRSEPRNAEGWFILALVSRGKYAATGRLAHAHLRQLVPPVT
jgi:predicted Zn-dependent protease